MALVDVAIDERNLGWGIDFQECEIIFSFTLRGRSVVVKEREGPSIEWWVL